MQREKEMLRLMCHSTIVEAQHRMGAYSRREVQHGARLRRYPITPSEAGTLLVFV
jgi:hypothetical protein